MLLGSPEAEDVDTVSLNDGALHISQTKYYGKASTADLSQEKRYKYHKALVFLYKKEESSS